MAQAADPLSTYLREQIEEIFTRAPELPDPVAVHRTRVSMRRLRSTLRVFAPLLSADAEQLAYADEELRWFTGVLGEARDRQVQRERFAAALAHLPSDDLTGVLGPAATWIEETLHTEQVAAEEEIGRAVASDRCAALRRLLGAWRREPPVADTRPGRLRKRARKVAKKAARRLRSVGPDAVDADLHRARKAAKRARYAAEVLGPLGHGKKQGERFKKVQQILGVHQDAVVARGTLVRLVASAPSPQVGFTLGVLSRMEDEQTAAQRVRIDETGH